MKMELNNQEREIMSNKTIVELFQKEIKEDDTIIACNCNNEIKSLNNLTSDVLQIGQVLKIPTNAGTNYITYTVVRGDSLYTIARNYNTTIDAIKSLNNLTSNTIKIDQTLKIPV